MTAHRPAPTTDSFTVLLARERLDALEQESSPHARIILADDLARGAESMVREAVADARAEGHSWATIAEWLRMSKAGAHKRFSASRT